jgi:hypothetical protein
MFFGMAIATLACGTSGIAMVRGDAAVAAVTLRYHFVPGETLTYKMVTVETQHSKIAGQPPTTFAGTTNFQAHYIVHSVDAAGNATMSVVNDPGHATEVTNGKTTHRTVPANQLSSPADACIQENDGTQYCVYRGGYGLNDFGQVDTVPVADGGTWNSTIDNTWGLDNPKPVTLHSRLLSVTSNASGRVAGIATSVHLAGPSTYDTGGKHYATSVKGDLTGTWHFGVDSGMFSGEDLVQTIHTTGTVKDKTGTHALTNDVSIRTTMQFVSSSAGTPKALGKTYSIKTVTPSGSGYALSYPSSWQMSPGSSGSYQIESVDKNALIVGLSTQNTAGDVANPAYVSSFLRAFGTPIGNIVSALRTIHGQQFGIADAVLRLKGQPIEAQVEARVKTDSSGVTVVLGIVSLGPPGLNTRPPNLARDYEQVQRSLDSIRPPASSLPPAKSA